MRRRVGAIFAHPDDEVLGCGGTRAIAKTVQMFILNLVEGITSREILKTELIKPKSIKILGNKTIEFCDFPDNEMDKVSLLK